MAAGPADTPTDPPTWTPSARELADLELLLGGALAPLRGFLGRRDLEAVRSGGTLADGTPWRAEVMLTVPAEIGAEAVAAGLVLTDPEGSPVARLDPADGWPTGAELWRLAGAVSPLQAPEYGPFREQYRAATDLRAELSGRRTLAVLLTDAVDTATLARIDEAAAGCDATLLLPLVGDGTPRAISASGLVRASNAAARLLGPGTSVVPVPLSTRDDGDTDAWLRAHVARAYGADEVLDLAGADLPGLDRARRALAEGEALPGDLAPGPVADVLAAEHPPLVERGVVVFFTGLSGSGKSTIARRLRDRLLERGDRTVTLLDGDVVRRMLSSGLGFSREDRNLNVRRIGYVAAETARHGGLAVCAPIAPYAATRADVRGMAADVGAGFVLVHVATSLEECERRDRKGLYARARAGLIPEFTGISDPYEEPVDADLVVDTEGVDIDTVTARVLNLLRDQGWLAGTRAGDDPAA